MRGKNRLFQTPTPTRHCLRPGPSSTPSLIMATLPSRRRLLAVAQQLCAAEGSEFPDGDPNPGPVAAGRIVIYGQPTSRVCKVMWMCGELGLSFDQFEGFAFRNDDWALELNPKG